MVGVLTLTFWDAAALCFMVRNVESSPLPAGVLYNRLERNTKK